MLTGSLGIRLVLLIGKAIPTPAPYNVMTALRRVSVTNDAKGNDGFQMTFSLGKGKTPDYSLSSSGVLDPDTRVQIGAMLGTKIEPLIDGMIFHHQVMPSNEPGMSTLTVTGRSISVMLELEEKDEQYKNQSDSMIATQVIGRYAKFLIKPEVTITTDVPIEIQLTTRQVGSDLSFLNSLADRNGFVFYIEPLTLGTNKAHWGPAVRLGALQPALSVNMGSLTNVNSLQFSQDALAPIEVNGSFLDPITKKSVKIPPLPSLRIPPLAPKPAQPRRKIALRCTANKNPARAATVAVATATNAPDAAAATGDLDTARYGHVLRARRLVGVRGAGFSNNGIYKVQSVTHEIEPGKYRQEFTLTREGAGALLPVIPT